MIKQFFSMAAEHKVVRDSAYSIGGVDKVTPVRMIFLKPRMRFFLRSCTWFARHLPLYLGRDDPSDGIRSQCEQVPVL